MKTNVDSANIRFPPPLIYLVGLLLGILGGRVLGLASIGFGASIGTALAGTFLLLGLVVNLAGAGRFLHLGTAIIPHKAASKLVTSGIYRWTRNPMYLGMALLYAGIAILFDSIGAMLLLPIVLAVIQTQVIAREEAYLERAFGDEYLAYKRRVRRWI